MSRKIFFLWKIFIIVAIFSSRVSEAQEYIVNGDFSQNTCSGSITKDHLGCQGLTVLDSWTAKKIEDLSAAQISIQNRTDFSSFPSDVQYVVPLDFKGTGDRPFKRTCIQQQISSQLPLGVYYLKFQAGPRQIYSGTQYTFFDYKVGIKNSDSSNNALQYQDLAWLSFTSKTITSVFEFTSSKTSQILSICSRPTIFLGNSYNQNGFTRATGVSQVSLTKIPEVDITVDRGLNVDLIQNGEFIYNNCLDKVNNGYGCQGTGKLLHWQAQLTSDQTATSLSVQNPSQFSDATDKYIVALDIMDYGVTPSTPFKRICIKQNIGLLAPGNYKLEFNSATRSNLTGTQYDKASFSVFIRNSDASAISLNKRDFTFSAFGTQARTQYLIVTSRKQDQYLYFCSEPISSTTHETLTPQAAGISNVRLMNLGCPDDNTAVTIPLDTGYNGCIPSDLFDSFSPPCQIFTYQEAQNNVVCTTECIYPPKLTLNTGTYACPIEDSPTYLDANCNEYKLLEEPYTYECTGCKAPYSLQTVFTQGIFYKRCLSKIITDCTVYSSDGVCSECVNEISPNIYFNICPQQSFTLIRNCKLAILGTRSVACIACQTNYIISPTNTCLPQVQYCELYADTEKKQCKKCVPGFYLNNNFCYKVQGNCEMFDPKTSICYKCSTGLILKNNVCVLPQVPCLENQYRNSQGVCVNGDTNNCGNYDSMTGLCKNCKEGYKFDEYWNCIKINTVTCPPDTADYSYVIELGQCKKVEQGCVYSGLEGCLACKQGFYLYNKQCYKIQLYQGLTIQT